MSLFDTLPCVFNFDQHQQIFFERKRKESGSLHKVNLKAMHPFGADNFYVMITIIVLIIV